MCPRIACLLGALALTACKTTPLDVVYAADVVADSGADADAAAGGAAAASGAGAGGAGAGGAGAGGAAAAAGTCSIVGSSIVGPGGYVLRSANGLCLGQGAPTMVFGNPGFLLEFAHECADSARSWQLIATPTPQVFTIQNLSKNLASGGSGGQGARFVLDVEKAATQDGTPVIIYGANGFDNQRFEVRARDTFASELRPQHHPQSCVSATADSAQITTCDPTDSSQAWLLQRSNCL